MLASQQNMGQALLCAQCSLHACTLVTYFKATIKHFPMKLNINATFGQPFHSREATRIKPIAMSCTDSYSYLGVWQ